MFYLTCQPEGRQSTYHINMFLLFFQFVYLVHSTEQHLVPVRCSLHLNCHPVDLSTLRPYMLFYSCQHATCLPTTYTCYFNIVNLSTSLLTTYTSYLILVNLYTYNLYVLLQSRQPAYLSTCLPTICTY